MLITSTVYLFNILKKHKVSTGLKQKSCYEFLPTIDNT